MTTTQIMKQFEISSSAPDRVLRNDEEILDFIRHCVTVYDMFNSGRLWDYDDDDDDDDDYDDI